MQKFSDIQNKASSDRVLKVKGPQEASERFDGNKSEVAPPKNIFFFKKNPTGAELTATMVESKTASIVRAVSETSCAHRTSKQRMVAFNLSKYARRPEQRPRCFHLLRSSVRR